MVAFLAFLVFLVTFFIVFFLFKMSVRRSTRLAAKNMQTATTLAAVHDDRNTHNNKIYALVCEIMDPILSRPKSSCSSALRRSSRLAKKPRKNYAGFESNSEEEYKTPKQPWKTKDVQNVLDRASPTYRELFRKYNLPLSLINHQRDHMNLESKLTANMHGTDYAEAIRAYCFFFKGRLNMDSTLMFAMLNANGLKDCATFIKTNTVPDKPTYDTKSHRIKFEPTLFDPQGALLYVAPPDFNAAEVKAARKTPLPHLRRSSFISSMRLFLEEMSIIVANKNRYANEKEYLEAKVQIVLNQFSQLLVMQDILAGDESLRRFTLTTESKAFDLIHELCDHPEINPILASETLFVLRSYIVMLRALMTALEE